MRTVSVRPLYAFCSRRLSAPQPASGFKWLPSVVEMPLSPPGEGDGLPARRMCTLDAIGAVFHGGCLFRPSRSTFPDPAIDDPACPIRGGGEKSACAG